MLIGTLPFFLRFSISQQAATIPAPTSVAGRPMISAPPLTAGKIQSASFSFMSVQPHRLSQGEEGDQGTWIFHTTPLVGPMLTGGVASRLTPEPFGPRNADQAGVAACPAAAA